MQNDPYDHRFINFENLEIVVRDIGATLESHKLSLKEQLFALKEYEEFIKSKIEEERRSKIKKDANDLTMGIIKKFLPNLRGDEEDEI